MASKNTDGAEETELSDAELVASGLAGDTQALASIYDRYADRLYDYALSILGNHADAGDAVHDSYVVAAERLAQLRDPNRLRPWLYAITRSAALAVLRRRKRDVVSDPAAFVLSSEPSNIDSPVGALDAQTLVARSVAGLGDDDRELLNLQLRHDLEGEALAEIVGESVNNVNVASHRMRLRLEQSMSTVVLLSLPGYKCSGLSEVASGELSPLVRKRAARHIDACDSCSAKRIEATSAAALFSSLPLIVAPDSLRERLGNTSQVSNQNSSNQDTDDDTPNGDRLDRSDRSAVKRDVEKGRSGQSERRSEKPSKPKSTLRRLLVGATVVVGVAALLSLFVGQAPGSASLGGQRVSGDGVSTPLGPDRSFDVGTPTGTAADGSPLGPTGPSGSAQPTSTLPSDSPTSTPPSSSPTTLPSDSPTTLPASTLPQTSMPDTPPSTAAAPARATVTLLSATCSPLRVNVRVMSQTQINSVTLIVTEVVPATGARLRYPMTLLTSDFTLDRWVATATGLESSVYRRSVEVTNAGGTTTLPISGTCDNSFE